MIALAGEVELAAVRQVASLIEVHAHDGVAFVQQCVIHREVGRRAGEGLHIDINIRRRDALVGQAIRRTPLRERLNEIDVLDALVERRSE